MFHDAKEELKRIEAELLAEEASEMEKTAPLEELPSVDEILNDETLRALLGETQRIENVDAYQNYSNQYGATADDRTQVFKAYNTDKSDADLQQYSDSVQEEPKPEKLTGLIVTAALLAAGIVGVLAYWVLRYWVLR